MNRVNTVSHVDCTVLTKLCTSLIIELMEWQKFTVREDEYGFVRPITRQSSLYGDSSSIVAAINLRDKLNSVIDRHTANNRA